MAMAGIEPCCMAAQQPGMAADWAGWSMKQIPSALDSGTPRNATRTAATNWRRRFICFRLNIGLSLILNL
jgi:hypothetical protein